MKKLIILLLTLVLILSAVPAAFATEVVEETTAPTETTAPVREPDQCGEDLRWKYEDGTLTISGTGAMDDYSETEAPWAEYKDSMEKLVLSGVTYIGAEAFRDYDKLEEIDFGFHIREFGTRAFYGCDGLESLSLPMSFKIFGEESLRACKNLKEIHCDGGFPSFRLNCMWESYVTIYFPAERPWPVSLIQELEEAFHGRIEFIASDGTDPYTPEAETEPTEPESFPPPTVPPTTEAPTEAPTEKPTEAPTEPPVQTEAPTEEVIPETEPPVQTQPPEKEPSQPAEEEAPENERSALKIIVIVMAAAVVLTVAAALLLIFRRSGKRGKYEF